MHTAQAPRFPTTQWSQVVRAADVDPEVRHDALAALLQSYLGPLRRYLVACRRLRADDVDDLLQDFVSERVLRDQLIPAADRDRGRFRTFLLTALNRFVSNASRDRNAKKRRAVQAIDPEEFHEMEDGPSPEDMFVAAWARTLLSGAVERTRAECEASERPDVWAVFDARVLGPALSGAVAPTHENLATQLALSSPRDASNLLVTGKRMFARHLRDLIGEYEPDRESIDAEIGEIKAILART